MRMIDADAVCELFEPFTDAFTDVEVTSAYVQTLTLLANAPSIDIVRCKECKHYAEHNELYINEPTTCVKHSTIGHYVVVNADDFCSYGEREGE